MYGFMVSLYSHEDLLDSRPCWRKHKICCHVDCGKKWRRKPRALGSREGSLVKLTPWGGLCSEGSTRCMRTWEQRRSWEGEEWKEEKKGPQKCFLLQLHCKSMCISFWFVNGVQQKCTLIILHKRSYIGLPWSCAHSLAAGEEALAPHLH